MLFHKSEDLQNTFNKQLEETIPSATGILAPCTLLFYYSRSPSGARSPSSPNPRKMLRNRVATDNKLLKNFEKAYESWMEDTVNPMGPYALQVHQSLAHS